MTAALPENIRLDPKDWYWATWRDLPPLPRPEPPPFDQGAACAQVGEFMRRDWPRRWETLKLPPVLSRSAAHFWLTAFARIADLGWRKGDIAGELAAGRFDGDLPLDRAVMLLQSNLFPTYPPEIAACLGSLYPLAEFVSALAEKHGNSYGLNLAYGLRAHVIPYLTAGEKEACRAAIREPVEAAAGFTDAPSSPHPNFLLHLAAAVGGFGPKLDALLEAIPTDARLKQARLLGGLVPIIFGLHDPGRVEHHVRRFVLWFNGETDARAWLAHTETGALDWLVASIRAAQAGGAADVFRVLTLVKDPAIAPHVLDLSQGSREALRAAKWLNKNVELAVAGLAPLAADLGRGPASEHALELLRNLKLLGKEAILREAFASLAPAQRTWLEAEILDGGDSSPSPFTDETTPAWLREAEAEVKAIKRAAPPAWADLGHLPPVRVGNHSLNADQHVALLIALSKSTLEAPHPFVVALKAHAEPVSLETFAWQVMEQWLERRAPPSDKWALLAVGLVGGDASALKLTRYILEWPGQSQHRRAALGLSVLQTIGTDTALMQLNTIAASKTFSGIRRRANEAVQAIAQARGITPDQLADRTVPTCDLDENGRRVFDYGRRKFTFVLGPDLKPVIREESGKLHPNLPTPGARDDEKLAGPAYETWKTLKKQVQTVAKAQAARLERALLSRRRWEPGEFQAVLVNHPLMINLVRLLIWGGYDAGGALRHVFRVTDERDFASIEDESAWPDGAAGIGLIHPVELSEEDRTRWQQVFNDYNLIQPFPQLQRGAYRLTPEEQAAGEIARFAGVETPGLTLSVILRNLDWQRRFTTVLAVKDIPFAGVTAVLQYSGLSTYSIWRDETLRIERVYFVALENSEVELDHLPPLPLADVDPVAVSEVIRDVQIAIRRGEEQKRGK